MSSARCGAESAREVVLVLFIVGSADGAAGERFASVRGADCARELVGESGVIPTMIMANAAVEKRSGKVMPVVVAESIGGSISPLRGLIRSRYGDVQPAQGLEATAQTTPTLLTSPALVIPLAPIIHAGEGTN
jgi:hypothetical protein